MKLNLSQILALNHALTALQMSHQWSQDMGYADRAQDDKDAYATINEMLLHTKCFVENPQWDVRNVWPANAAIDHTTTS